MSSYPPYPPTSKYNNQIFILDGLHNLTHFPLTSKDNHPIFILDEQHILTYFALTSKDNYPKFILIVLHALTNFSPTSKKYPRWPTCSETFCSNLKIIIINDIQHPEDNNSIFILQYPHILTHFPSTLKKNLIFILDELEDNYLIFILNNQHALTNLPSISKRYLYLMTYMFWHIFLQLTKDDYPIWPTCSNIQKIIILYLSFNM